MSAKLIREATRAVDFDGPIGQYSRSGASVRDLVRSLRDALERAEKEQDEALTAEQSRYQDGWQDGRRSMTPYSCSECDHLRAENERLEDRVTQLEERLRHEAAS